MATRKWKSELLVNTSTAGDQTGAAVTALQDGGFVIAWLDKGSVVDIIRFQRFDALGNMVGAETIVPQAGSGYTDQGPPAITALSDGRFYISAPVLFAGTDNDLSGAVYNSDGTVQYQLNAATTVSNEFGVAVTGLASAATVSVWVDEGANGGDIKFLVVDSANQPVNSGTVNTSTTGLQDSPAVAANPDGSNFVVVWRDTTQNSGDIRVRTYDSDGTVVSSELAVANIISLDQQNADVAFVSANTFVVAWDTHTGTSLGREVKYRFSTNLAHLFRMKDSFAPRRWERRPTRKWSRSTMETSSLPGPAIPSTAGPSTTRSLGSCCKPSTA